MQNPLEEWESAKEAVVCREKQRKFLKLLFSPCHLPHQRYDEMKAGNVVYRGVDVLYVVACPGI